jgi:polysaccharide biosynthesis/export protein
MSEFGLRGLYTFEVVVRRDLDVSCMKLSFQKVSWVLMFFGAALLLEGRLGVRAQGPPEPAEEKSAPSPPSSSSTLNPSPDGITRDLRSGSPALNAPPDYVIGMQDLIDISVLDEPELNQTCRVANDGTIALPLIGRLKATGLTADQLRSKLQDAWGKSYLVNPQITVFVREFHAQPVSVVGAVDRPGVYQLTSPHTLIEVISMAGGLAKKANDVPGRTVFVTRKGGFADLQPVDGMEFLSSDRIQINLHKLFYSNQGAELNIPVQPFDIIAVSQADVIYVTGRGVQKPGAFVLDNRDNISVMQALAMAEGLSANASKRYARIIRQPPNGPRQEIPVNLDKVTKGKAPDPILLSNDVLFVPDSAQKAGLKKAVEYSIGTLSGLIVFGRL